MDVYCPQGYSYDLSNQQCLHSLSLSIPIIVGSTLMAFIGGLSSLSGLGGGMIFVSLLIMFFQYQPKDATFMVFPCIMGATLGNSLNQMTKTLNNKQLVMYHYILVSLPMMMIGAMVGVLLNKLLPIILICLLIEYFSIKSLRSIYLRFRKFYQQQNLQNSTTLMYSNKIINQAFFNPFQNPRNLYIFKKISLMIVFFAVINIIRGNNKFDSIIGIENCSLIFWLVYCCSMGLIALLTWDNLKDLKKWKNQDAQQNLIELENKWNLKDVMMRSTFAGIMSGFGLGGGIFLVPMYNDMGCNPLQATASTTFTILLMSGMNCLQGVFMGMIQIHELIYLLLLTSVGSFFVSRAISKILQRMNRLSFVQAILICLIVLALINIPISLWIRYISSGYDSSIILAFGNLC